MHGTRIFCFLQDDFKKVIYFFRLVVYTQVSLINVNEISSPFLSPFWKFTSLFSIIIII